MEGSYRRYTNLYALFPARCRRRRWAVTLWEMDGARRGTRLITLSCLTVGASQKILRYQALLLLLLLLLTHPKNAWLWVPSFNPSITAIVLLTRTLPIRKE